MTSHPASSAGQIVFAGLLTAIGLAVVVQSISYGVASDGRMGPGAASFIAGLVVVASAGWVLCTRLLAVRRNPPAPVRASGPPQASPAPADAAPDDDDSSAGEGAAAGAATTPADRRATVRSMGLLALLVAMLAVSYWVGLLAAAVGFVFVVAAVVERVPLRKAALLAGIAGLAIWGIFVQLLGVQV